MRSTAIPDLVALAMQASDERIEQAMKILKGDYNTPRQSGQTPIDPFKTLTALAKETGIGRMSLWRWRVPGHKHAGRVHYRTSEVLAYLETPAFQATVAALKANGWRRPTDAQVAAMLRACPSAGQSADSETGDAPSAHPTHPLRSGRSPQIADGRSPYATLVRALASLGLR